MIPVPPPAREDLRVFRGLLLFSLVAVVGFLAYHARAVVAPFLLAALLAYVVSPLVTFLELGGLRRSTAVGLLYVAVILIAAGLAYWTFSIWWGELPRLRREWPLYLEEIRSAAARADGLLSREWPWVAKKLTLARSVRDVLSRADSFLSGMPVRYLPVAVSAALHLFLIPFVGFFFLKGGRKGFQAVLDACPGRWVEKFLSLLYKAHDVIGGYLRGVLLEAFLVGLSVCVGLLLLHVDYAGLLGAMAMVFNLVPFFGPLAAGSLAVTAAFLQTGDFLAPAHVALLFLSLRLADDFIIQPLVMNRAVHLHPALVIFSLLAGHEVAGAWGLLAAIPVVSIVKESSLVVADWYRAESGRAVLPPSLARAAARPWVV